MVPQTGRTKISPQPQVSPLNNVDSIENPRGEDGAAAASPLLEIVDLRTHFFTGAGAVRAVDGVSWQARRWTRFSTLSNSARTGQMGIVRPQPRRCSGRRSIKAAHLEDDLHLSKRDGAIDSRCRSAAVRRKIALSSPEARDGINSPGSLTGHVPCP
jgi:hypothetical protein